MSFGAQFGVKTFLLRFSIAIDERTLVVLLRPFYFEWKLFTSQVQFDRFWLAGDWCSCAVWCLFVEVAKSPGVEMHALNGVHVYGVVRGGFRS